jgi:hypothetical protein
MISMTVITFSEGVYNFRKEDKLQGGILAFKKGKEQFTIKQNDDCYKIASVRIHVEHCIHSMKRFKILEKLPSNKFKHIDQILVIISALCNCSPDLIDEE